jgi:methionine synthase I (cobalamin-dependent)
MTPREAFVARAAKQILVFDGGYGTAIQGYCPSHGLTWLAPSTVLI